jgi:hypothetical protein
MLATNDVLKRRVRDWPARPVIFCDLARGMIHENGTPIRWDEPAELELVLDLATVDAWEKERPSTLYLLGGWNAETTPPAKWFDAPEGWTRLSLNRYPLIAQYKGPDGHKLTIYGTAQWFGQCASVGLCRKAYLRLRQLLRAIFDEKVTLMGTPARTGLDLLERSLPRNKDNVPYEYPALDAATHKTLESEIGQGRMECVASAATPATDTLYIEDAIWMYASCIRHLPAPPLHHDEINEFAGYRAGFYRVLFRVPGDWQHIGLLPVQAVDARSGATYFYWPDVPGPVEYMSVVGDAELRLALENGWSCEIVERWLFADDRAANADPLRQFAEKLRALREAVTDEREGKLGKPLRDAIRALLIKMIGGLHRRGRTTLVETPIERAEEISVDAEIEEVTPSSIFWRKPVALDASTRQFAQPHWAAMVWSRARAKLNKQALMVPRECIVWLRSDALVLTFDPGWTGTKPGEFRCKRQLQLQGREIPTTEKDYRELLGEGREE